jgi:hypothetical protein
MTDTATAAPAAGVIALDIHICAQRRSYRVTFTGPDAEAHALAFLAARTSTHAFAEIDSEPIDFSDGAYPLLHDFLYPVCEHGLSADLCYGPQHYYFDEEEQARGMFNS